MDAQRRLAAVPGDQPAGRSLGGASGRLILVAAAVGWGLATTGTKYALNGFDPMTMLTIKLLAASMVLWAMVLVRGGLSSTGVWRAATLGLFEPALAYGGLTVGLLFTSASNASVISVTESCFVLTLAWIVLGERLQARGLLGVAVAVCGVLALGRFDVADGFNLGDVLILASSASAAVYVVLAARTVRVQDPLMMTTVQFSFAGMLTLAVTASMWATGRARVPDAVPLRYWAVAVIVGGVFYAGSFVLYNHAIRSVAASLAGAILNLVPVVGVLSAFLLLSEDLTAWHLLGTLLVTVGVLLVPTSVTGGPPPSAPAHDPPRRRRPRVAAQPPPRLTAHRQ
ncbi:DMT family transporter [Jiangella muralis]|uniref:DMT family transporter n=1 Tax=Jiangella muralis TaxID=702383 RepID=UPI00069CDDB4|nr:EamA family transporter [Jiangella muralis]